MNFNTLNSIARGPFLPKKRFSDLNVNETYAITKIRQVNTKYGVKTVVEIDEEFQLFLPNRVCKALDENEELFHQLAAKVNKYELCIKYLGGDKIEFVTAM